MWRWWVIITMFESHVKIDKKRRITIPARQRSKFGNVVVIKMGLDNCLEVHPLSVWEKEQTKSHEIAKNLSITKEDRMLRRFLYRGEQVDVDASGRILIPEQYADYAKLKEDVILFGNPEGFEVWSKEQISENGLYDVKNIRKIVEDRFGKNSLK